MLKCSMIITFLKQTAANDFPRIAEQNVTQNK